MWRSLVALSRLVTRASLWGPPGGLPLEHCKSDRKCVVHASCCEQRTSGAAVEPLLPGRETPWQGLFRLGHLAWVSLQIPHGKSLLCEDCSLWLELSAAGVGGVAGFLAESSLPSPSECWCIVSSAVRLHPLEWLLRLV